MSKTAAKQVPTESEYLRSVVAEMARYGHRDVPNFTAAFIQANASTQAGPLVCAQVARTVRDNLEAGLKQFKPGHVYFSTDVYAAYLKLVADFNHLPCATAPAPAVPLKHMMKLIEGSAETKVIKYEYRGFIIVGRYTGSGSSRTVSRNRTWTIEAGKAAPHGLMMTGDGKLTAKNRIDKFHDQQT